MFYLLEAGSRYEESKVKVGNAYPYRYTWRQKKNSVRIKSMDVCHCECSFSMVSFGSNKLFHLRGKILSIEVNISLDMNSHLLQRLNIPILANDHWYMIRLGLGYKNPESRVTFARVFDKTQFSFNESV
ncbi:hypothetical protein O6H91_18G041400 [Diphasiastrum complanatum]|uniref:Uncharacterized protein n=1 Tax=Diphasiastrum complanatum TaxID=34168 RepID=A0ACC2B0A8_DIPCM|nr:hypothetical protein O6H91_18G041400 [Diphasiastrum complanatum]